ncbi:hypothetical protein NQ317_003619 [Molorchus minor]|uniref:XRCC4 coiled-coil domain-containing protein n=1 Tax=Molorchus minor TaxID=1323400 RepID=A0ABQ9JHG1_9CUCU|nr:hypothetical protein NQ317_003619 [Molorchus minor]
MDTHFFKVIEGDEIHGTSFRINVEFKEDSFNLTVIQKLKAWFVTVDYSNCMENLVETFYTDRVNSLQRLTLIEEERYELQKVIVQLGLTLEFIKSKDSLETQLNEFINRKKTDEEELYSKFVLVLNEKKKRIQHLNELLATFRRGRPTLNPPVTVKKRTKKHEPALQIEPHLKKEISDSESEDDYNTDEEKEKKLQNLSNETLQGDLNDNRRIDDAIPSTSKCDIFSDNSPPRHLLSKKS